MVKRIAVILCALLLTVVTALSANASQGKSYICGDADCDGDVSILDVTVIQRYMAEIQVPFFDETAADVNSDGLDISDATMIQRFLAGIRISCAIGETVIIPEDPTEYPTDPHELPLIYS